MMKRYRTVFFGTPEFSVPFLKALKDASFLDMIAVVTEPDKPKGRGRIMTESPVANYINKILRLKPQYDKKIEIMKPDRIVNCESKIMDLNPDLFVVVAYGQIIPGKILHIPKLGAINVHPSDLPRYRGPAPIQAALLNGDNKTAISVMLMDNKMDHGSLLDKLDTDIDPNDDYPSLEKKILNKAPLFLVNTLEKYLKGVIKPSKQDHKSATFTKMIEKRDGLIDWKQSPQTIHNQIRAYASWPKAYTFIGMKRLNILKSHFTAGKLYLDMVQLEGKKPVLWKNFLNGYKEKLPKELTIKVEIDTID